MTAEAINENWKPFLAENPPTVPHYNISVRGVEDAALGKSMADAVSMLAETQSRLIPLQGLDGITIAADYAQALRDLDRGVDGSDPIAPTSESFGTGVAMTSGVVREGEVKSHVTLEASIIAGLILGDEEMKTLSVHTVMHELGHVAEQTLDWQHFGDAMLRPINDRYENALYQFSHSCWSEYYASRVSAAWGENVLAGLRELLRGQLEQCSERVTSARARIGPLAGERNDEAASEIIDQVGKIMKFAGYVLGHAGGAAVEPIEADSPEAGLLEGMGLDEWFADLGGKLDTIYEARLDWADLSVFHPLHRSFEAACVSFGLRLDRSDAHAFVWQIFF